MFIQLFILVLGFTLLISGANALVNGASGIAKKFNIPEIIISLTIVSLGTSLPELVTCVVALIKHDDDIAEGNIIGSCIINFCLILGLGATISNLPLTASYIEDLILLLFSSILIWLYGLGNKNNTLTRGNGFILLIIYLVYSITLFI